MQIFLFIKLLRKNRNRSFSCDLVVQGKYFFLQLQNVFDAIMFFLESFLTQL